MAPEEFEKGKWVRYSGATVTAPSGLLEVRLLTKQRVQEVTSLKKGTFIMLKHDEAKSIWSTKSKLRKTAN